MIFILFYNYFFSFIYELIFILWKSISKTIAVVHFYPGYNFSLRFVIHWKQYKTPHGNLPLHATPSTTYIHCRVGGASTRCQPIGYQLFPNVPLIHKREYYIPPSFIHTLSCVQKMSADFDINSDVLYIL